MTKPLRIAKLLPCGHFCQVGFDFGGYDADIDDYQPCCACANLPRKEWCDMCKIEVGRSSAELVRSPVAFAKRDIPPPPSNLRAYIVAALTFAAALLIGWYLHNG